MGFFKGITKSIKSAVKKVEDKIIEPIAKDAIPLTAAYFTNGKSAQFLPPKNVGERLGKITGMPINALLGVGGNNGQIVEDSASPPTLPQSSSSIYDQISNYWPFGNNQTSTPQTNSLDVSPNNARVFDSQPVQQAPQSNKLIFIIGGVIAVVGVLIFAFKRK